MREIAAEGLDVLPKAASPGEAAAQALTLIEGALETARDAQMVSRSIITDGDTRDFARRMPAALVPPRATAGAVLLCYYLSANFERPILGCVDVSSQFGCLRVLFSPSEQIHVRNENTLAQYHSCVTL